MLKRSALAALLAISSCGAPADDSGASPCGPWAKQFQGNCVLKGAAAPEADGGGSVGTPLSSVDVSACQKPEDADEQVIVANGPLGLPDGAAPLKVVGNGRDLYASEDSMHLFQYFDGTVVNDSGGIELQGRVLVGGPFMDSVHERATLQKGGIYSFSGEQTNTAAFTFSFNESKGTSSWGGDPCTAVFADKVGSFEVVQNEYFPMSSYNHNVQLTVRFSFVCVKSGRILDGKTFSGCAHFGGNSLL
jgi:hypothetical protein